MSKNSNDLLDALDAQNQGAEQEAKAEVTAPNKVEEPKEEAKNAIPKVFDKFKGYKASKEEKDLFHLAIAKVHFNQANGEYDGQTPYIQKMNEREYKNFANHATQLGYTYYILYSPKK